MKKASIKFKKFKRRLSDRSYHARHKKQAFKVLKDIESVKGKTDKKLIDSADIYAKEVLGSKRFAPWLYVYCAIRETFVEGWIPDNYYGRILVPKLKGNYGAIANFSSLTGRLFKSANFPNVIYLSNGQWLSTDYEVLSKPEALKLIQEETSRLLFKTDNSSQGRGIHFLDKDHLTLEHLESLGNGVIQTYINQHPFFQDISPNSVSTLRVTSTIDNQGEVTINACYLRVGRNQDTHVKPGSHIRVPVNQKTGDLDKNGYSTKWHQIDKHPDTKFVFEGKQIPHFDKIISTTKKLHKMVPFAICIGWDMIIDVNNEVKVMEWNGAHNDIKFSEATQGPCFANLGWEKL